MPYGTLNVDKIVNDNGVTFAGLYGFKNRIINGGMVIDQRNAGASVTQTTALLYPVDRFVINGSVTSKFTAQRSTTAPPGFPNSLLITSSAATTPGSTDYYLLRQAIEGFNTADFAFGSASAQSITLSFWVRSSLTGTFGGSFINQAANRWYVFSYSISAANTWEYKTITVAGDTSGTWATDNTVGLYIDFSMGAGASLLGAAGSWGSSILRGVTGQTNLVATNGATFYITGVQLEKGSTATSFDFRPYGTELMLCQRYYEALSANAGSAPGSGGFFALGVCELTTRVQPYYTFKVVKRAAPSTTLSAIGTFGLRSTSSSFACTSGTFGAPTNAYAQGEFNNGGGGLVAGGCAWLTNHTGAATIEWSAEL